MLKADLHIHTKYSLDCSTSLEEIIGCCQERGVNCIAVSDHGTIEGALEMQKIAPFSVIIAEEIMTPYGEIMGMFLTKGIPSGLSVEETISKIRAQSGLVIIPHPFDRFRPSALDGAVLADLVAQKQIDAIEVFNSRTPLYRSSNKAGVFARKHGILGTAGSDAHTPYEVGNAYVEMPEFSGREDFLESLARGKIIGRRTNPLTHFQSVWARLKSNLSY